MSNIAQRKADLSLDLETSKTRDEAPFLSPPPLDMPSSPCGEPPLPKHLLALSSIKDLFSQIQRQDHVPTDAAHLMRQLKGILADDLSSLKGGPASLIHSDDHLLGQDVLDRDGAWHARVISVMMRPSGHLVQLDNGRIVPLNSLVFEKASDPLTGECKMKILISHVQAPLAPFMESDPTLSPLIHSGFGGSFGDY